MFITIEGIDGAGKTCVARIIAERLKYTYSGQKALSYFMEIEEKQYLDYCDKFRNNVCCNNDKMYWLYALSCLLVADIENVICDRHLPTVNFWYGNERNSCIPETIYNLTRKPDITFILDVNLNNAIKRVNNKFGYMEAKSEKYFREIEKAKKAPQFISKAETFCRKYNINYRIIDTNDFTTQQVANKIIEIIEKTNGCN